MNGPIPDERRSQVARALQQAFRTEQIDDIRALVGGLSRAQVFRVVVRGKPYLLRLSKPWAGITDPTRQFTCMQAASDAGIAPRIWYSSATDHILLSDFVEPKPFPGDMIPVVAPVLRKLHSLPNFPAPSMGNYLDVMDGLTKRLQESSILPENVAADLFPRYAAVAAAYPRGRDPLVASHNDLKPQNMVFDGHRLWLVDWEAAFLNDEYVDLAVVANFFVQEEVREEAYLSAYFGEPPGEYRRARFYLMRQIVHMAYVAFLLPMAVKAGLTVHPELAAPPFRDFVGRLTSGEEPLLSAESRPTFAKVHLNQLRRNLQSSRIADAISAM